MTTPTATIQSLFIGNIREIAPTGTNDWWDKTWETGFYKSPTHEPAWLGYEGFRTDEQADRRYHGGVDKAVCVYPAEHYEYWRNVLDIPDFPYGAFGENLTLTGLTEEEACIGDVFSIGEVLVQVSQPRQPCWKLARRWRVKDLTFQVERTGFTGFYFRVLNHGNVQVSDGLLLLERPNPQWTIARCNHLMHHDKTNQLAARELAGCPTLSASWKDGLWARATRPEVSRVSARVSMP